MTALHLGRSSGPRHDRVVLTVSIGAVVGAGWAALLVWGASPWARYLGHEALAEPRGGGVIGTTLFVGGWLLMTVAMMLPTTWPLLVTFRALVGRRRRPGQLVAIVCLGYVVTWTAVGLALHTGDRLIHVAVDAVPWLAAHSGLVAAGTLLVAGVYQFMPLKYRCLDECRSPLGFVLNRWQGTRERREALMLGISHGLFCVGCCWSLMLVMFAVGMGSLVWMFGLGLLMAVEKNAAWGRSVAKPLGIVLIASGASLAVAALLPSTMG